MLAVITRSSPTDVLSTSRDLSFLCLPRENWVQPRGSGLLLLQMVMSSLLASSFAGCPGHRVFRDNRGQSEGSGEKIPLLSKVIVGVFPPVFLEERPVAHSEEPHLPHGCRKEPLLSFHTCQGAFTWSAKMGRAPKSCFHGQRRPACKVQDSDNISFQGIHKNFTNSFWRPSSWFQIPGDKPCLQDSWISRTL